MVVSQISRVRRMEMQKKKTKLKRKQGICLCCTKKALKGRFICKKHLEYQKKKYKEYKAKHKKLKKTYSGVEEEIVESIDDLINEREPKIPLKLLQTLDGFKILFKERVEAFKEDTRVIVQKENVLAWSKSVNGKLYFKQYRQKPHVKARVKAYNNLPRVKAKRKEWVTEYYSRTEVKARRKEWLNRPEIKAKIKLYDKQYYKDHQEKKKEYGREYAKRNISIIRKNSLKYYYNHREKMLERSKIYFETNKVKILEQRKKRHQKQKLNLENPK